MVITFIGNAKRYFDESTVKQELHKVLVPILKLNPTTVFYCGCKGSFDSICADTVQSLKTTFPDVQRLYITPYLTEKYQKEILPYYKENYDGIIFPDVLTTCPIRYSYVIRNQSMIREADIIISGVMIGGGGSETALRYAFKLKKQIIPVAGTKLDWL